MTVHAFVTEPDAAACKPVGFILYYRLYYLHMMSMEGGLGLPPSDRTQSAYMRHP